MVVFFSCVPVPIMLSHVCVTLFSGWKMRDEKCSMLFCEHRKTVLLSVWGYGKTAFSIFSSLCAFCTFPTHANTRTSIYVFNRAAFYIRQNMENMHNEIGISNHVFKFVDFCLDEFRFELSSKWHAHTHSFYFRSCRLYSYIQFFGIRICWFYSFSSVCSSLWFFPLFLSLSLSQSNRLKIMKRQSWKKAAMRKWLCWCLPMSKYCTHTFWSIFVLLTMFKSYIHIMRCA